MGPGRSVERTAGEGGDAPRAVGGQGRSAACSVGVRGDAPRSSQALWHDTGPTGSSDLTKIANVWERDCSVVKPARDSHMPGVVQPCLGLAAHADCSVRKPARGEHVLRLG